MCDRVTRWLARLISKNILMCLIRLGRFFKIGITVLNWLSITLEGLLLMPSTADVVECSNSAGIESLAVVWEVRESEYTSSSPLSSSPHIGSGEDRVAIKEFFRSAEHLSPQRPPSAG